MRAFFSLIKSTRTVAGGAKPSAEHVVAELLTANQDLLTHLRDVAGMQDTQFDSLIRGTVRRYAQYVYDLPAGNSEHHQEKGGLLRHGLEVAHFAARACDVKFVGSDAPVEIKRYLKQAWRYAAFLTGLLHDLGRVITVKVWCDNSKWNPYLEPLTDWVLGNGTEHARHWQTQANPDATRMASVMLAKEIIPPQGLQFLQHSEQDIIGTMNRVLSGTAGRGEHFLADLVDDADAASIENDLDTARKQSFSSLDLSGGRSTDRYIVDELRVLARQKWTINSPGAYLWKVEDDLYVSWVPAAKAILRALQHQGIHNLPNTPASLAELLLEKGHILCAPESARGTEDYYWLIQPKLSGRKTPAFDAVKLSDPTLLINPAMSVDTLDIVIGSRTANRSRPSLTKQNQTYDASTAEDDSAPINDVTQFASPQPAETDSDPLRKWCEHKGIGGSLLLRIAEAVQKVELCIGEDLFWSPVGLCVKYPEVVQQLGFDPHTILKAINAADWLVPYPENNNRYIFPQITTAMTEMNCFVFKPEIGKKLDVLTHQALR